MDKTTWFSTSHLDERWEVRQIEIHNWIFAFSCVKESCSVGSGWNLLARPIQYWIC
jgi:hypothetical protein